MKIQKQKRRKTFNFNKNRKRLNKTRRSTGKVQSHEIKQYWNDKKTAHTNAREMGISSNPNKTIPVPNRKKERLEVVKFVNGFWEEEIEENQNKKEFVPRKGFVVDELVEEATAPRESQLRLPKGHIAELIYFMDKYKLNFKDMVKDRRNHYQYTWRQFRSKIRKFMSIPEQFNEYLASKNIEPDDFKWEECQSDDDE